MNWSPPPPSFTLPPLRSSGRLPVTPSPTPSPNEKAGFDLSRGGANRDDAAQDVDKDDNVGTFGRVSMYVQLFEGTSRFIPCLGVH